MRRSRQIVFATPPDEAARQAQLLAARAQRKAALIQRRARRAADGLARWEKRLRRARREVAAFKRTVTYYRKHGVIP
jgi:hypothetical protein